MRVLSPVAALGAAACLAGAAEYAMRRRGDTDIVLDVESGRGFYHTVNLDGSVTLQSVIPFAHRGKQQGCVLDCTARVLPDGDRHQGLTFDTRVSNLSLPRDDGYFEAIMFKKKDTLELGLRITVSGEGDVWKRLQELRFLSVEFRYCFYMRSPLRYRRAVLPFPLLRTTPRVEAPAAEVLPPEPATAPPERQVGVAIPVRTHILTPADRMVDVIRRYALPVARPGDVVAVAESALAIMQGRLQHVEDIQPRFLARCLCRLLDADSSLSTPYGLEIAFQECGTPRMLAAFAAGIAGKVQGRTGDFYRVAGPDVACIDDASGTLPPFDKYVVLGPARCQAAVDEVKAELGVEAAIVDANDLKKCYVVALSDSSLEKFVVDSLIDNPQGNAGEQTPIIVIPRSA